MKILPPKLVYNIEDMYYLNDNGEIHKKQYKKFRSRRTT